MVAKKRNIDKVMHVVSVEMGITNAEFCRRLGESPQNLNNWIKRGSVSKEGLAKVSEVIGKSIDWILTECNMSNANSDLVSKPNNTFGQLEVKELTGDYLIKTDYALKFLNAPPKGMEKVAKHLIELINELPNCDISDDIDGIKTSKCKSDN